MPNLCYAPKVHLMKKYSLLSLFLLLSSYAFSQCGFTLLANSPNYCQGANGGPTTVTVTGGVAPYTYQLNNGNPQANNVFNNLLAGTYTIYVTDATPCMDSVVVTGNAFNLPNVTASATYTTVCNGGSTKVYGSGGVSYAWTGGIMDYVAFVPPATTTYTVTASDMNGCTNTSFITITVSNIVQLNTLSTANPSCIPGCDGTAVMDSIPGVAPFAYSVSGGANNVNNAISNICANTNYTITCSDNNGCVGTTSVQLAATNLVFLNPVITLPGNCGYDGNFPIQGGVPPFTWNFQPGNFNSPTGQLNNIQPGITYTITVMDNNACSVSTTYLINPVPALSLNAVNVVNISCNNGPCDGFAEFTIAGGAPSYTFNILGPPAPPGNYYPQWNMFSATNLCAGNYTLVVTDSLGCTDSSAFVIAQPPVLNIDSVIVTNVLCNGNCNGTVFIYAVGGVAPLTYSLNGGMPQVNPAVGALCAGTYTVVVSDANGCSVTSYAYLTQPTILTLPAATYTNPTCLGITDGTITVAAAGGTPNYLYALYPGNVVNANGVYTNLPAGTYTVIASDTYNCSVSTVFNLLPAGLNYTVNIISNLSCSCNGSVEVVNILGGAGPYTHSISPFANQPVPGTFDNMCSGVYTITVTDINNCSGTTVVNFSQIQINYTSTNSQCNGVNNGSITCTALFGVAPYTFTLNPGNVVNGTGIFSNLAAGTYTIDVADFNLCSNTITVTLTDLNNINVSANLDTIICGVQGFSQFFPNGGYGGGFYTYTINPGNIVQVNNNLFNNLNAGSYTLTVTNPAGCIKVTPFDIVQLSGLLPTAVTSTVYNESCNMAGDGAIDIIPVNPNGLTYLWNNNAVTQDLTNITSGQYTVKITDASGNCKEVSNTVTPIAANCGSVSGNIFHDANSNCIADAGETFPSNIHLTLSNGATAITNYNGDYYFSSVPYGTFAISQNISPLYAPNACIQPTSVTVSAANNIITNIDFKDTANILADASVQIFTSPLVPGFNATYQIFVFNNSMNPLIGNLWFKLNSNLILNSTFPANQGVYPTANGDSIVWNNVNITPNNYLVFNVDGNVPANIPLGTIISSDAYFEVTNFTDYNLANNYFINQSISQGAFDPNDKSVNPVGEGPNGNITLQDSILNYLIRFQNTGTDSAHNIYILDTLSNKLDINTLQVTGFSHPYKVEIINSNILQFKFDNIMLPDSNTNGPMSHGYIAYSIEQTNTNQIGDVINNTANIYFDFNVPIITNTTINTIAFPTYLSSPEFEKYIHVYPNPATDKLSVEFNTNSSGQSSITLTNTLGQTVKTILANTINGKNTIELSVKELPKGLYLLKIMSGKSQSMKKVVIE